jgi:hypothetical protein
MTIATAAPAVNTENWKPVAGYEGIYAVSDHGRIKRVRAFKNGSVGRFLRPGACDRCGHLLVCCCSRGRKRTTQVHRLVLAAFVGPCPDGMECRHLDGNPANNRIENLCWGTRAENNADRVRHGTGLTIPSRPAK